MVRDVYYRIKKFDKKIHGGSIALRFDAWKTEMSDQQDLRQAEMVDAETIAKSIAEAKGVATIKVPFYLSYARQLYRMKRRFSGETLKSETQYCYDKWKGRGLLSDVLVDIAEQMGLVVPAP